MVRLGDGVGYSDYNGWAATLSRHLRNAVTGTSFHNPMGAHCVFGDRGAFASVTRVPVTAFLVALALRLTWHPLTNHPNEPLRIAGARSDKGSSQAEGQVQVRPQPGEIPWSIPLPETAFKGSALGPPGGSCSGRGHCSKERPAEAPAGSSPGWPGSRVGRNAADQGQSHAVRHHPCQ